APVDQQSRPGGRDGALRYSRCRARVASRPADTTKVTCAQRRPAAVTFSDRIAAPHRRPTQIAALPPTVVLAGFGLPIRLCDFTMLRSGSHREIDPAVVFGGIVVHRRLLLEAGFVRIDCVWRQSPLAIVAAYSGT